MHGATGGLGPQGSLGPQGAQGAQGPPGTGPDLGDDLTVTFQPGGTVNNATLGIFADFGMLCTYIASVATSVDQWTIQVDGSFQAGSAQIPTGTYALPNSTAFVGLSNSPFYSYPTLSGTSVVFAPAPLELSFTNLPFIQISNLPVVEIFNVTGVGRSMELTITDCTFIDAFAGSPYFAVSGGAFLQVELLHFAGLGFGGGGPLVTVDSTSSAVFGLFDSSSMASDALAVDSGGSAGIYAVDSAPVHPSLLTAPGVAVHFLSLSSQIQGIQTGATTLVAGVSPTITGVTLGANSRIVATRSDVGASTALGELVATARTSTSFQLTSQRDAAPSTTETGDVSAIDWHILN